MRDEDDHVNLTRVKVQMDMAVANQLNQTDDNPEGTRKTNFQPQEGKFIDVYSGPNQSLVIIGVTAKGQLWKKELYKGFFDIFDNWVNLGRDEVDTNQKRSLYVYNQNTYWLKNLPKLN